MVHTGPKYDAEGFPGGLRSEGYQRRTERAVNAAPTPAAEKFRATNAANATSKFLDKRPSLAQRSGDVLVDDQPLPLLIFPNHGPAEVAHLNLAGFRCHLFFYGRRGPDRISVGMDVGIIVHGELGAFVARQNRLRWDEKVDPRSRMALSYQ